MDEDNREFLGRVKGAYPQFCFKAGRKFMFRPRRTIIYEEIAGEEFKLLLLHELGHATLGHFSFKTAVERLAKERDAWEKTRELAEGFGVEFDEEMAQGNLDTYREFLHQKTLCPECGLSTLEIGTEKLFCPGCQREISSRCSHSRRGRATKSG